MQVMLAIHLTATLTALLIGAWQLVAPKGTRTHKKIGWLWLTAMTTASISSFFLHGMFTPARWSPIHILSAWTLICVAAALYFARVHNIRRHQRFTVGAYIGLVLAGLGALTPGRLLSSWLFHG